MDGLKASALQVGKQQRVAPLRLSSLQADKLIISGAQLVKASRLFPQRGRNPRSFFQQVHHRPGSLDWRQGVTKRPAQVRILGQRRLICKTAGQMLLLFRSLEAMATLVLSPRRPYSRRPQTIVLSISARAIRLRRQGAPLRARVVTVELRQERCRRGTVLDQMLADARVTGATEMAHQGYTDLAPGQDGIRPLARIPRTGIQLASLRLEWCDVVSHPSVCSSSPAKGQCHRAQDRVDRGRRASPILECRCSRCRRVEDLQEEAWQLIALVVRSKRRPKWCGRSPAACR
mmetsp:Transcript_29418/g.75320  ORF Transcript_29418/g.75320 Transcript_29418/m.75320 type:complete len:289 (-) Transcript_29418:611-1477(-)